MGYANATKEKSHILSNIQSSRCARLYLPLLKSVLKF